MKHCMSSIEIEVTEFPRYMVSSIFIHKYLKLDTNADLIDPRIKFKFVFRKHNLFDPIL